MEPIPIARIRGKGLVILTGCGHSGIVNVVRHVQRDRFGDAFVLNSVGTRLEFAA